MRSNAWCALHFIGSPWDALIAAQMHFLMKFFQF